MRWAKVVGTLGAAAVLVGSLVGSARSAALLWDDFEKGTGEKAATVAKQTPWGGGWRAARGGDLREGGEYLRYSAQGVVNPAEGTIEVEVIRSEQKGELEALFAVLDAEGKTLLKAEVYWERGPNGAPVILVNGGGGRIFHRTVVDPLFGTWREGNLVMPAVGVGRKAHISLSWGRREAQCEVSVNGRTLDAQIDDPRGLVDLLKGAASVVIGGEPDPDGSVASQSRSVIKAFYVHDQAISGSELYAHPERYRPAGGTTPTVAAAAHDASRVAGFSGKLVAGNVVNVSVQGTPGVAGSFDVVHYPDVGGSIALDWRGWGVYLEEKRFYEAGEVNLRDVEGYDVYAANVPFDPVAPGREPVASLKTAEQSHTLEMLAVDTPYYVAVTARMRDGSRRVVLAPIADKPLAESTPGLYSGTFQTGWIGRYPRAAVVGRLTSGALSATLTAPGTFEIDPSLTLAMTADPAELKADEKSSSKISVTVTNANGAPVSGHRVRFLLATTSQYTGMVGGGAFTEQVGGAITEERWGRTDLFGRVTATYVAGFAAKTAIIVARDMVSNSTGAASVKTFIQATAGLDLEPVRVAAAEEGYAISVTSSDDWLTADGKSQARITAKVTRAGQPVEGHAVSFSVSAGAGTVRAVRNTTDSNGEARAVYTAGRKIGIALITATDTTVGISGSVSIELRSDAPAKIAITVDPERLPADGRSRAEVQVAVTDINDNPSDNVEVEYRISEGDGRLRSNSGTTDRRGESAVEYQAGRTPGRVTFEITVRSTVATDAEMAAARALAVAVTDYNFF